MFCACVINFVTSSVTVLMGKISATDKILTENLKRKTMMEDISHLFPSYKLRFKSGFYSLLRQTEGSTEIYIPLYDPCCSVAGRAL